VEILLVMWEDMPERISVNIRTSGSIDAGKLAALYGGGGHVRAAGFTMNTTMQKLFESIQKDIAKFF
ncbi:MAG: DHH family phosphoesterase, partial [Salinispira sp.]